MATPRTPAPDQSVDPAQAAEAWITLRRERRVRTPNRAAAENVAVLHYRRTDGDYAGLGPAPVGPAPPRPTEWGTPLPPAGTDAYGAVLPGAAGRPARPR